MKNRGKQKIFFSPWLIRDGRIGRLAFFERAYIVFPLLSMFGYYYADILVAIARLFLRLFFDTSFGPEAPVWIVFYINIKIFYLLCLWMLFCAHLHRLHDMGVNWIKWWIGTIWCVPILIFLNVFNNWETSLAIIIVIMIWDLLLLSAPMERRENRYGPPPDGYDSLSIRLFSTHKNWHTIAQPLRIQVARSKLQSIFAKRKILCWPPLVVMVCLSGLLALPTALTISFHMQTTSIDRLLSARNLGQAVEDNIPWAVHMWIAIGADINIRDGEGNTLLHRAVFYGNHEIAKILLEAGADPNIIAHKSGQVPLHNAVSYSKHEIAKTLLEAGADLNARDSFGVTPLHVSENLQTVKMLLNAGADPNTQSTNGDTPLHYAARYRGSIEIAKTLLETGADPNIRNKDGDTPLNLAIESNRLAIIEILLNAGAIPIPK